MGLRPSLPERRRGLALGLVLPAIILLAALGGHQLVVEDGKRRERERLDAAAARIAGALQRRVRTSGDVLYGVRGLFGGARQVTAAQFHASLVAQEVHRRYPGVQVVGYADLLARRGAPLTYMEPWRDGEPGLLSEPRRREALERTLRTNRPEATAPVRLGDAPGLLIMLATRGPRGRAIGSAYAAFRIGRLVEGAVPARDRRAGIELYDLGPASARAARLGDAEPSYDSDARRDAAAGRGRFGSRTVAFETLGRRWALFYAPDHSLRAKGQLLLDWLPLIVGGVLALLAGWLLRLSSRTERRAVALAEHMTESLRASQTELARSNAELERFAYVASHDLREPLRTITGFLGLLSRRHGERLGEDGREFVGLAVQGAKRMDELIAELLEYSRAGRRETIAEPTDLDVAWRVAVRNLSAAIADAGAEVTAGPLPVVMADRGEMVQVLQNLLGNALKYRGEGNCHVHAEAVRRGDEWEVSVIDDGPGIDPRHHARIFVLLQRLHRHDEVEGTGMGLAICKKIVEHHGGRIWVESDEGDGARFTFALPAAAAVREPVAA
jgi:signal transduction histidine kinase